MFSFLKSIFSRNKYEIANSKPPLSSKSIFTPKQFVTKETELTEVRNTLNYKLIYIANNSTIQSTKRYLSYFGNELVIIKIHDFLNEGYIKIASISEKLNILTLEQLKSILRNSSLTVSGKKCVLIERILNNVPENKYITVIPSEDCFVRTEKGNAYYKHLLEETNTVLYDVLKKVADFAFQKKYKEANELANNFYLANNFKYENVSSFGLRATIDYHPDFEEYFCKNFDRYIFAALTAFYILGKKVDFVFLNSYLKFHSVDTFFDEDGANSIYMKYLNIYNLCKYKRDGIQKYEILSAKDDRTCEKCKKMNGKTFLISEATPGVNYPPFCDDCRCTVISVIPDDWI